MELRTDTDRIDWLEQHQLAVYKVIQVRRERKTTTWLGYDEIVDVLGWTVEGRSDEAPSIREAIDFAIDNAG